MSTTRKVLGFLVDGIPRGIAEIAKELGLGNRARACASIFMSTTLYQWVAWLDL